MTKHRPREPNADECRDILEDVRRHFANDAHNDLHGTIPNQVYNDDALNVLTAWLRHRAYFHTRACARCGKAIGPNPKAIYCSVNCRTQAYHDRTRNQQPKESK